MSICQERRKFSCASGSRTLNGCSGGCLLACFGVKKVAAPHLATMVFFTGELLIFSASDNGQSQCTLTVTFIEVCDVVNSLDFPFNFSFQQVPTQKLFHSLQIQHFNLAQQVC